MPQADIPLEPRNFTGYKGPRRFYDEFARGTPRFPIRKGSGFGVEFRDDITRAPYVPGELFVKRTWATRPSFLNRFGYEPYRRSSDRRRPYGGYARFSPERPPVLGDFGDFKPYRRMDDTNSYAQYNYSRPTRSYTFPPRLRFAIRNASMHRRAAYGRYNRYNRYQSPDFAALPTLPSVGLEAYLVQNHDYYGNLITPKGRIMNLQALRNMFPAAEDGDDVSEQQATTVATDQVHAALRPKMTAKPKGMTAKEAMRAAAREAIREAEQEAIEAGDEPRRRSWRRGGGPRADRGPPRAFRRVKRSPEEHLEWLEKQSQLRRRLYDMSKSDDYLTGPGKDSSSSKSKSVPRSRAERHPLRMRRRRG